MALPRYCQICEAIVDGERFRDGPYDPEHRAIAGYCGQHSKREVEIFERTVEFKRFADAVYRSPGKRYIRSAKLIPITRIPKLLNLTSEEAADIWDGEVVKFLLSAVDEYESLSTEAMWEVARYIDATYSRNVSQRLRQRRLSTGSIGG